MVNGSIGSSIGLPKVSVVIPVYNAEDTVVDCIDSVLGQDFPDLEIVVVDDGSNDGSGILCDNCARRDSRVKVIHQKNKGRMIRFQRMLFPVCMPRLLTTWMLFWGMAINFRREGGALRFP